VKSESIDHFRFARMALRRAIGNLVDNALRHAGEPVEVELMENSKTILVEVRDRGPGIPAGEVERLKRPFTRLNAARSGAAGAGLGLAIVERIARAHDGTLELLPREGGGLVARLVLAR
jgi:two-component system, OmpR family, osmolarity sensor histidine kinase EnvZ